MFCRLISTISRNCSTRQLDPSRTAYYFTTQLAAQEELPQSVSQTKEMEPRLFNNTITDSSMEVSISLPQMNRRLMIFCLSSSSVLPFRLSIDRPMKIEIIVDPSKPLPLASRVAPAPVTTSINGVQSPTSR